MSKLVEETANYLSEYSSSGSGMSSPLISIIKKMAKSADPQLLKSALKYIKILKKSNKSPISNKIITMAEREYSDSKKSVEAISLEVKKGLDSIK
jgi:hypothetical protein